MTINVPQKPSLLGLASLVGLQAEKEKARIEIAACRHTGEVFNHTLLTSCGGLGKTAFARALAYELNYHFVEREAASLRDRNKIIELLTTSDAAAKQKGKRLALFIDEVHRLSLLLQETFYFPMKEHRITTQAGDIKFAPFCLIAATTRRDMLDEASFVDRFPNKWEIGRYDQLHIEEILCQYFAKQNIYFGPTEITLIAQRCLGIPRQATNIALKVRNYIFSKHPNVAVIEKSDIKQVFELEKIDDIGLSDLHVRYMFDLYHANGQPRGLKALSGRLGQHEDVLIGTVEPVLMSLGFIDVQPRGRVLTDIGFKHLATCHLMR